jgi:hypothetical protein
MDGFSFINSEENTFSYIPQDYATFLHTNTHESFHGFLPFDHHESIPFDALSLSFTSSTSSVLYPPPTSFDQENPCYDTALYTSQEFSTSEPSRLSTLSGMS